MVCRKVSDISRVVEILVDVLVGTVSGSLAVEHAFASIIVHAHVWLAHGLAHLWDLTASQEFLVDLLVRVVVGLSHVILMTHWLLHVRRHLLASVHVRIFAHRLLLPHTGLLASRHLLGVGVLVEILLRRSVRLRHIILVLVHL